ncbi:TerB family tellurite resistance protein [Pararhodobacter sp. SW119]|uniref:tellurite resistance TerB family protein n=1 Tax=Pararhodobacter sp. SW119 TaxID=2780075 RepID=UPI001AE07E7E|nr:TerB family tellurite resistance protein [Pararhodobacter sp. SW119]
MIDALKSLFRPQAAARIEVPPDVAIAALLVEAARADGSYDADEREAVGHLLEDMLDLDRAAATALRERGEVAQEGSADLVRFTRVVKFALEEHERVALIEALWHVVLVDHHRDPHEDALLRRLPPLLGLSDHDSSAARRRVMARAGERDDQD